LGYIFLDSFHWPNSKTANNPWLYFQWGKPVGLDIFFEHPSFAKLFSNFGMQESGSAAFQKGSFSFRIIPSSIARLKTALKGRNFIPTVALARPLPR